MSVGNLWENFSGFYVGLLHRDIFLSLHPHFLLVIQGYGNVTCGNGEAQDTTHYLCLLYSIAYSIVGSRQRVC